MTNITELSHAAAAKTAREFAEWKEKQMPRWILDYIPARAMPRLGYYLRANKLGRASIFIRRMGFTMAVFQADPFIVGIMYDNVVLVSARWPGAKLPDGKTFIDGNDTISQVAFDAAHTNPEKIDE